MPPKPEDKRREREIDQNLRRVYQRLLDEEVPDRFLDLLERLKDQDENQGAGRDE